jgi:hypothetical protein
MQYICCVDRSYKLRLFPAATIILNLGPNQCSTRYRYTLRLALKVRESYQTCSGTLLFLSYYTPNLIGHDCGDYPR